MSATDLPEYLEVDMADVEIGTTLHISDITLPKGVESVALSHGTDHDLPIAAVNKPKAKVEDEPMSQHAALMLQAKLKKAGKRRVIFATAL